MSEGTGLAADDEPAAGPLTGVSSVDEPSHRVGESRRGLRRARRRSRRTPRWVLGARRIRSVDASWPDEGSRFHHAIGNAAGELHDSSKVLERDRPHRIVLEVRFRPTGVARVTIETAESQEGTEVVLEEHPERGPFALLPRVVTDPMLWVRNLVSLQRLRHEIERRADATTVAESGRPSPT